MPTPPPQPLCPALCPECGTPTSAAPLILPFWIRARRLTQAIALLIALCVIAYQVGSHWPAARNHHVRPSSIGSVDFPDERFTRADLEAMAEDANPAGDGNRLLRTMRILTPSSSFADSMPLVVAFIDPAGETWHVRRWGWPESIVTLNHTAAFSDVYTLDTPVPPALRGRKGWMYDAWWDEWIDPRLGRAVYLITPYRLATPATLIALAWALGLALRSAIGRIRHHQPPQRPSRFVRRLPLLFATAAMLAIVVLCFQSARPDVSRYPKTIWPPTATTTLTHGDLRTLLNTPAADRTIARAILDATQSLPDTGDTLVLGNLIDRPLLTAQYMGGWPRTAFDGHLSELARTDTTEPTRVTWSPKLTRDSIQLIRLQTGPVERIDQFIFKFRGISSVLLFLLALWLLAGLPATLAAHLLKRRARRRASRGDCLHCGYESVRPRPTPTLASTPTSTP